MRIEFRKWVIPTGVGITSFGAGVGVGYFLLHRKFNKKINLADVEIEELKSEQLELDFKRAELDREFNQQIQQSVRVIREFKERGQEFLKLMANTVDEARMKVVTSNHPSNGILKQVVDDFTKDDVMVNVFTNDDEDDWDYEEELKNRTPDHPYIIHRDEYFSNEMDCSQSTLTYYAGDNIFTDEQDVPIYNPDKIVGDVEFGKGSRDPSICYVRNEDLMAEYEILLDHGYYQQEVLGESVEGGLKHSRPLLKFRKE